MFRVIVLLHTSKVYEINGKVVKPRGVQKRLTGSEYVSYWTYTVHCVGSSASRYTVHSEHIQRIELFQHFFHSVLN